MPDIRAKLAAHIDMLLSSSNENYTDYLTEEIFALSVAVLSHRRLIRTHNFNALTREFSKRLRDNAKMRQSQIDKLQQLYQEELDTRAFNFCESSVQVCMSDETTAELLKRSQAARLMHPKVQDQIRKLARNLVARASNECQNAPVTYDDFRQDLMLYLIEKGEANFNPLKAAYTTYALTTLHFRAKYLLSLLRDRSFLERLSDFANNDDTSTYDEKLQGASLGTSSIADTVASNSAQDITSWSATSVVRQYDVAVSMKLLFTQFTPLERSALFLKNRLSCKSSSFPFQLAQIIHNAESRGADALHF